MKKSVWSAFLFTALFAINANAISSDNDAVDNLPRLAMATDKSDFQTSVSDFLKLDKELAFEVNGVIPAKLPSENSSKTDNNTNKADKTAVTGLGKQKTPKFTDNAKRTAKSATAVLSAPKSTVAKKKQDLEKSDLPLIKGNLQEMILPLDQASLSKEQGNKSENAESNIKCKSELPCIPMFNRYVLKLDENDAVKPEKDPKLQEISKANQPKFESDKIYTNLATNTLPSLGQVRYNNIPLDNEILTKKPVSKDLLKNKAVFKPSYLSSSPLVAKFFEQGIIIGEITPSRPKIEKSDNDPESLKNKSTDELIDEQQKLYKLLGVTGNFVRSYSEAEDKAEFIKSLGLSKVNGVLDSQINEYLKAYDGVNAEISSRLSVSKGNWKLQPEGKLLVPLWSKPKSFTYLQTGLTTGTVDRKIAHLGVGERIYPQAKSLEDLGHHMLGFNAVVDKDLSRGHTRGSVGLEYMHDNLKLVSNIYRRLSSWKDSPDFEKGYVQERPASGWDLFVEYWFKAKLAIKAGVTHWIGRDISPFGDTNEKNLENDPYIYEAGIKYTPVPAISLEAKHQHTNHGNNNSYIGINFNIPLGDNFSFENAFNPDAVNKAQGNNIMTSRSMFIERDYTMPLQYRSKPCMYYVNYINQPKPNQYLFRIEDGFHRGAIAPLDVKASHSSIKFSNDGNYISDSNGYLIVEITHSAVTKTTLTIAVGCVTKSFEVEIQHLDYKLKADPETLERWETSDITCFIESDDLDAISGTSVKWRIRDGQPGTLDIIDDSIQSDGTAKVIYHPDTSQSKPYNVDVIARVYDVDFSITLHIVIYGNGAEDFSLSPLSIDGGQYSTVTYKNLKPNSTVDFSALGVCQLVLDKPEEAIDMTGTSQTAQTITVPVDENGIATAYAVGSTVVGDSGKCHISTKTLDQYLVNDKAQGDLVSSVYDPSWEVPSSVLYLEPFTAKLLKLKNSTDVVFSAQNNSASISNSINSLRNSVNGISSFKSPGKAILRLASAPNSSSATKTVVVVNNQAQTDYLVTGDYNIDIVSGIHALYYHDAKNTAVDTSTSTLAITQFTPKFSITSEEQDKLNIFSGNDVIKVKLIEGQPHRNITIVNPESNVTVSAPDSFNALGEAEITIEGHDLRNNDLFSITALAMGKEAYLKDAVLNNELRYHTFKPVVFSTQGISGENITDTAVYQGMPKFKDIVNSIDYKTDYEVVLDGLLPNTHVTFTADNSSILNADTIVNSQGQAKVSFKGVSDFNIKQVIIHVHYQTTSTVASLTVQDFVFNLYQYQLSISSDKSEIMGDETAKITVTGGRPGETVTWSNTGSGTILSAGKSTTFDAQGNAYATVQGTAPFTDTVKTSASTFTAVLSNKIQLVNIYRIKGANVAECHLDEHVQINKFLYKLDLNVKKSEVEKAYITATLTAEGDDEFIFILNNSSSLSLPSNGGSCSSCSSCGGYTNFYINSSKTFDVTSYLKQNNSIYVYFRNIYGGYSFNVKNLVLTIKTYSKL